MNLNQLYYFNELAKQQQFSKAAKNLGISQPSLSNSIKSLENSLGCKLINRSGGQITLTEYGNIFYKASSASIDILESAKLKIQQKKRHNESIIKIASIPSAFDKFLPTTIQTFKQSISKDIKFYYQTKHSNEIYRELESGTADLGICLKSIYNSNLAFLPLYHENIVVLTKKGHPLSKHKVITVQDLINYDIITYSDKDTLGRNIRKSLLNKSPNLTITATLDNEMSIAAQVISNNSVGISVDNNFIDITNIDKIKLDIPKDTRTIYLAYNPKADLSIATQQLITLMTNYYND